MLTRMLLYAPTKTESADGGGVVETLGTATELYGAIALYEAETRLTFQTGADVQIGRIIVAGDAWYRVVGTLGQTPAPMQTATLEAVKKPLAAES